MSCTSFAKGVFRPVALLATLLMSGVLAHAAAPSHYALTDLDWGFRPLAVNDAGEVAGFSLIEAGLGKTVAGKVDQTGLLHTLGAVDGLASRATAVNSGGLMVGSSTLAHDAYTPVHAVVFDKQGQIVDIGSQLGGVDYGISRATGVNSQGQVAGTVGDFDMAQDTRRAFIYQQGTLTDIGSLGGGSFANGINNLGAVTGGSQLSSAFYAPPHAFIYSQGQMKDLGTLGGLASTGQAINDAGQVTGFSGFDDEAYPGAPSHAFLYTQGQMRDLGTLAGDLSSFGWALNASGAVVGSSQARDGTERAFLYQDGQMVDLNSYLRDSGHAALARAYGISDRGVIVGVDRDGRGFMMSPSSVPEPETTVLALCGLMLAGVAARPRAGSAVRGLSAKHPSLSAKHPSR